MPKQREKDEGLTGIFLPTGECVDMNQVRSFNYNPAINALRFSFNVQRHTPVGVDPLTNRVKGVQESEGRCVVIAHRHFRYLDSLYVQDADVRIIMM